MASVRARRVLPGFGLSLGFTLAYLSLIVLIPLSAVFIKSAGMGWDRFVDAATSPRVVASYKLSFGASLLAAAINAVFGLILAWGLVRYTFPGKKLVDALIDLPFALPTAVAGISLTALYAKNGWIGQYLEPLGIQVAFKPLGVLVALVATRERRWLATRWPYIAAAIALLIGCASLIGQVRLGFPVLGQMQDLQAVQLQRVTPADFLLGQVMMLGPSILLALAGLGYLLLARATASARAAGVAALVPFVLLLVVPGEAYYAGRV